MSAISAFPVAERAHAKVNLALHILGRRADGLHDLDSVVAFAEVGDLLTLEPAEKTSLAVVGPFAAGLETGEGNLVIRAYRLLAAEMALPPTRFTLTKNLPIASGIGGGSADAAAALRGLMRLAGRGPGKAELDRIALMLGADVPVCLAGRGCRMRGVGEDISPLGVELPPAIVLANPGVPCATAAVFRALALAPGESHGVGLDPADPAQWRNDLQTPALGIAPVIADVLTALSEEPSLSSVRMSGSGATCFGLAPSLAAAEDAAARLTLRHPHWWIAAARLR